MFKLLTLSLATAFTIYGLDEMKFINADDFDVAAARINAFETENSKTTHTKEANAGDTTASATPETSKVAIKHQRFTDRIANKNKVRVQ